MVPWSRQNLHNTREKWKSIFPSFCIFFSRPHNGEWYKNSTKLHKQNQMRNKALRMTHQYLRNKVLSNKYPRNICLWPDPNMWGQGQRPRSSGTSGSGVKPYSLGIGGSSKELCSSFSFVYSNVCTVLMLFPLKKCWKRDGKLGRCSSIFHVSYGDC